MSYSIFISCRYHINRWRKQEMEHDQEKLINKIPKLKEFLQNPDYSASTIEGYQDDIVKFFEFLVDSYGKEVFMLTFFRTVDKSHIENYFSYLESERGYSNIAINRKLSALRAYFTFCIEKGLILYDPTTAIDRRKIDRTPPQILNKTEIQNFLQSADSFRNQLMIRLNLNGLHAADIENIKISNINQDKRSIKIIRRIKKKTQIFEIDNKTIKLIMRYIKEGRGKANNPKEDDFLFLNSQKDPIKTRGIQRIIRNVREKAEISIRRLTYTTNLIKKQNKLGKFTLDDLETDAIEYAMQPTYTIEDFIKETGYSRKEINGWKRKLLRKKQVIIQGPPGTGKTFIAERLARWLVSKTAGFSELVQFHPTYSYEEFIQGMRPEKTDDGVTFEIKEGKFLNFCNRASETGREEPCVLVIDEINRAHLSRVFGELMYLLEYRDKEISLAAGGIPFKIPENIYIIGTMNTADRSIALVDYALRRRFTFIRLKPEYDILANHLKEFNYPTDSLIKIMKEINKAIDNPDYKLGISFFLNDSEHLKKALPDIWEGEIEPYLEQIFYDQPDKLELFRWEKLVETDLADWAK